MQEPRQWDEIVVVFANTGEEWEQTLEFVRDCDRYFNFNTVWIEAVQFHNQRKSSGFKVVDFETASRNGEPFEDAIKKYGIPNQKFKDCTRNLKTNAINSYAESIGWKLGSFDLAIGIRVDEIDRVSMAARQRRIVYPLIKPWPMTKPQINHWWSKQPFRLRLKGYQGNCKWCWKKSLRKHLTIIQETPEVFDFPMRMEEKYGLVGPEFRHERALRQSPLPPDYRRTFFRGNMSTKDLFKLYEQRKGSFVPADDQNAVFDEEYDLGGGCEESCEVWADEDSPPVTTKKKRSGVIHHLTSENPRRPGTHGHRSWEIAEQNPAIEDYIKAGGRMNDLRWDIERGWAEIRDVDDV